VAGMGQRAVTVLAGVPELRYCQRVLGGNKGDNAAYRVVVTAFPTVVVAPTVPVTKLVVWTVLVTALAGATNNAVQYSSQLKFGSLPGRLDNSFLGFRE